MTLLASPSQNRSSPAPSRHTMRAARIVAPGEVRVEEAPIPQPQAGQVLVKLEGCGVCGSNIPVWEGREWFTYPLPPGNPGHEGYGRVAALGEDVRGFEMGDRVALLSGSAFAEYDAAPATDLVRVPEELGDAPFPGEPLACAMNVFARSGIRAGDTVAIIGIGFLGAVLTRLAADAVGEGGRVVAITRRPFALGVARGFGAAETVAMDDHWRIIDRVKGLTDQRLCDVVIEAVGAQWPLDLAGELTRERGRLVVAGYHQDGPRQVNMQMWNWRGLDVINAHEREQAVYTDGMRRAAEAVASGRLDPSTLYTHRFPLERLGDALEAARTRPDGFMKAIVTM